MTVLYVSNPNTGRKVEYKLQLKAKTCYQKLVDQKKIILGQVIVDNLATDYSVPVIFDTDSVDKVMVGKLLGKSNLPVYETNFPDRVVKIGLNIYTTIQMEKLWYSRISDIVPKFYGKGVVLIKGVEFPCLVIEKLDYTLQDHLPTTRKQVKKVWKDMKKVRRYLKTKKLVYNDFKPTNIMWSSAENQWKLIDLESIQECNTRAYSGHTPVYAPSVCLREEHPILNDDTDEENLMWMIHDLVTFYRKGHHDPWVAEGLTPEDILDLRNQVEIKLPKWLH